MNYEFSLVEICFEWNFGEILTWDRKLLHSTNPPLTCQNHYSPYKGRKAKKWKRRSGNWKRLMSECKVWDAKKDGGKGRSFLELLESPELGSSLLFSAGCQCQHNWPLWKGWFAVGVISRKKIFVLTQLQLSQLLIQRKDKCIDQCRKRHSVVCTTIEKTSLTRHNYYWKKH